MARRHWLVLGVAALFVSAVSRVTVAGPVQIEPEAYGGSAVGQWTCGPSARARYGGVGGHARVYLEDQPKPSEEAEDSANRPLEPDTEETSDVPAAPSSPSMRQRELEEMADLEPHGFSLGGGGGGEYRAYTRLSCADNPCAEHDVVPPSRLLGAGRANFGFDWDYFGIRAGALGFQRWNNNYDVSPTTYVVPDIDFRIGRRAGFHGGFGFGAYDLSTISRPGAYLTMGLASGRWAGDVHGGLNLAFDDEVGARVDVAVRYSVSRAVAPGIGLAATSVRQVTPEGRVFLVFTP